MLFLLVTAMYPQFLITLDEEAEEKAVTVRVGQAVNTVGLAGTRMGISGVSHPSRGPRVRGIPCFSPFLPHRMGALHLLSPSPFRCTIHWRLRAVQKIYSRVRDHPWSSG